MKISRLYGKKIIGEGAEGYVVSVETASGGKARLMCADKNEREFYLDLQRVKKADEHAVYVGAGDVLGNAIENDGERFSPLRLGRAAFDQRGNYLGKLAEATARGGKIARVKIGLKNYAAEEVIFGDVIIVRGLKKLKADVCKNGAVLFKKGTPVTRETLERAADAGEYVQTTLKSL